MAKLNPKGLRRVLDARKKGVNAFATKPSPSITAQYARDLNKLVIKISKLVKARIFPILEEFNVGVAETASGVRGFQVKDDAMGFALSEAFLGIQRELSTLDKFARTVATSRMLQANGAQRQKFITAFKKTVGVDVSKLMAPAVRISGRLIDKGTIVEVNQAIHNNIKLIETIPKQHLDKIKTVISEGIASGADNFSLVKEIEKVNGQNTRRARLIARDQMQKLNSVLAQARQQDLGIKGYIWRTSQDVVVRDSHEDNDGKRFSWDNPPRETGHPGEDINCRCVAEPDMSQLIPSLTPQFFEHRKSA